MSRIKEKSYFLSCYLKKSNDKPKIDTLREERKKLKNHNDDMNNKIERLKRNFSELEELNLEEHENEEKLNEK